MLGKIGIEYFDRAYWLDATKSGYRNYNGDWPLHHEIAIMLASILAPLDIQTGLSSRVLDYGGAFGFHVAYLAELIHCEPFLVDGSRYAIDNRHQHLRGAYFGLPRAAWLDVGTTVLPWPNEFFDRIAAIEIMEHIYEPEVPFALKELWRVMRSTAFAYSSIAVGDQLDPNFIDKTHQTIHPMEWWEEQFLNAGFRLRNDLKEKALRTRVGKRFLAQEMGWQILCFEKPC